MTQIPHSYYADSPNPFNRQILCALFLSILLHSLLLLGLSSGSTPKLRPIEVTLLRPTAEQKLSKQIVSPSDTPEELPSKDTKFLADKNTKSLKETILRGTPDAGTKLSPMDQPQSVVIPNTPNVPQVEDSPPVKTETKKIEQSQTLSPKQTTNKPQEREATRGETRKEISKTILTNRRLAAQIAMGTPKAAEPDSSAAEERLNRIITQGNYQNQPQQADSQRVKELYDYQPFRRRSAVSLFSGSRGVPDHLPQIQDGDITTLNAKADRHAVFVRRVALQVFGILRRLNWAEVPFSQVFRQTDFVTVDARMSLEGKLLSVEISSSSGVQSFDKVLLKAAREGTWDQNPPKEAVSSDGTIHFVFKSRTWALRGAEAVGEQRWLLLATGLL